MANPVQSLRELCVRLSLEDMKLSFLDWFRMPLKDLVSWRDVVLKVLKESQLEQEKALKKRR